MRDVKLPLILKAVKDICLFFKASPLLSQAQKSLLVLGFEIDSFGIRNLFLYFGDLVALYLGMRLNILKNCCKKTNTRMSLYILTGTVPESHCS